MRSLNRIFADFNNMDIEGRVRLTCIGTLMDLNKYGIILKAGLEIILDSGDKGEDELFVLGTVEYSKEEHIWVARIDRQKFNVLLPK